MYMILFLSHYTQEGVINTLIFIHETVLLKIPLPPLLSGSEILFN